MELASRTSSTLLLVLFGLCLTGVKGQCGPDQFKCENNVKCIPEAWKCDQEDDCGDGSEEVDCPPRTCSSTEFKCINEDCIPGRWHCDGDEDCTDGSDEHVTICAQRTCRADQFSCGDREGTTCIPSSWVCDDDDDCDNSWDERGCENLTCQANEFTCDNRKCIMLQWHCDYEDDCGDNSDELGCPEPTCSTDQFRCNNSRCIMQSLVCDGDHDCLDHSDEGPSCTVEPTTQCSNSEFACANGFCILETWKCDTEQDCLDGSDEQDCHFQTCAGFQFTCDNGMCIEGIRQCNGVRDCPDGSDEFECSAPVSECREHEEFRCHNGNCIPMSKVCDQRNDCKTWEDEPIGGVCNTNECETNNGSCDHLCTDLPIGHYCSCKIGYELVNVTSCVDINECKTIPGTCSHRCYNNAGSFKCTCDKGYILQHGKKCRATGPSPVILFSNRHEILSYNLHTKEYHKLYHHLESAVSIDYDMQTGTLLWSDVRDEKIYKGTIHAEGEQTGVKLMDRVDTADGIAMDWIHRKVYWTDTGNNSVGVTDFDTGRSKTLFPDDHDEPRAIVVDPETGYMFWTEWGYQPSIQRGGMNGEARTSIVTVQIAWPNGITIDYASEMLYWVDAKLHMLSTVDFTGHNRRTIINSYSILPHPFSITVFEDYVYWTDWTRKSITRANKFDGADRENLRSQLHAPMDIQIYHPLRQPNRTSSHCGTNNGGCSDLCVAAPQITDSSARYSCLCPDGVDLLPDQRTCRGSFNTEPTTITKLPHKGPSPSATPTKRNKILDAPEVTTESNVINPAPHPSSINHAKVVVPIAVILFILLCLLVVVGIFLYRKYYKSTKRTMHFDNPVYRKTTENQVCLSQPMQYEHNPGKAYKPIMNPDALEKGV